MADAAEMLGWSAAELAAAIDAGEVEVNSTSIGTWIWREELMSKALEIGAPDVIDDALGADAHRALPERLRITDLCVRLPRHHVDMLRHFAERDRTTVSGVLARELDGVASAQGWVADIAPAHC